MPEQFFGTYWAKYIKNSLFGGVAGSSDDFWPFLKRSLENWSLLERLLYFLTTFMRP